MEMIFSPRSTSPRYFGFKSTRSASFSCVHPARFRCRRISSPISLRCRKRDFRLRRELPTPAKLAGRARWLHQQQAGIFSACFPAEGFYKDGIKPFAWRRGASEERVAVSRGSLCRPQRSEETARVFRTEMHGKATKVKGAK